ncbi:MAG: hypothetical protein ABI204_04745, partial [Ginsengibacter sp.]
TDYAFVNGLALSVNSKVDMSFLYRKISPQYQSLYTSAFTESTFPTNESGFYTSIDIAPTDKIRINAYADYFHFPWVKYRIDAPSYGRDYLVQFTYTPDRNVEIYARYNNKNKAINFNPDDKVLNPVDNKNKQGLRVQFRYKLNRTFTIRSRVDLSWYDKRGNDAQTGFLTYFDIIYKKVFSPVSGNIRLLYFETTGYDARLYAFENDVLYGYSIPVFSGKGYRYYLNINYKLNKSFQFWGRLAQTIYLDRDQVGSGLDLINGNKRTEVKLQAQYSF